MLIPERPAEATEGTAFCSTLPQALDHVREERLLAEFLTNSNVPDFYRNFVEVTAQIGSSELVMRVAPDYLVIGSDVDHVRIPLNPLSAQKVADAWGCLLPTKKIVDLIWKAAPNKLSPQPLPPTSQMTSVQWFLRNNDLIEKQLKALSTFSLGQLVAGHKKDVVITSKTFVVQNKVAIYGWHEKNGHAIQGPQPNASSHDASYADYSHGIRLVDQECVLDGAPTTVQAVLADPVLCKLLSEEGPVREPRYKV